MLKKIVIYIILKNKQLMSQLIDNNKNTVFLRK